MKELTSAEIIAIYSFLTPQSQYAAYMAEKVTREQLETTLPNGEPLQLDLFDEDQNEEK